MRNRPFAQKSSLLAGPARQVPIFLLGYVALLRRFSGVATMLRRERATTRLIRGEVTSTLLRAKPSKDGDAELRDYGDASR